MPTYRSNILIFSELADAETVKWLVIDIGVKSNKKRSKLKIFRDKYSVLVMEILKNEKREALKENRTLTLSILGKRFFFSFKLN